MKTDHHMIVTFVGIGTCLVLLVDAEVGVIACLLKLQPRPPQFRRSVESVTAGNSDPNLTLS